MKIGVMRPALALFLLATATLAQQRDFSQVQIESQPVAGNVHMLVGAGGNIGVSVGEDGILIVDDQFAALADKIKAALADLQSGPVEFLLNTHFHFDHTGGNEVFGLEALILAHDNVRSRLAEGGTSRNLPPAPKVALPVVTFDESVSIWFNGEEVRALHQGPAHTDGDAVVWFVASNVIHMGDQFFNGGTFPFVDLEAGGSVVGLLQNIEAVLEMAPGDARFIAGHGPLGSKADLENYRRMLEETIGFVSAGMKEGMTLDQLKERGVPAEWQSLGEGGFIRTPQWVETIYRSLEGGL